MRKILTAVAILALTAVATFGQTNTSTAVSSNSVATTGLVSQATGDIVGSIVNFIAKTGSAGVGYAIPLTKSAKNIGDGPEATVQVYLYDVAWVSAGVTNIDSKLGI